MEIFPLICLISAVIIFFSGVFVYLRIDEKKTGMKWFLFMAAISVWIIGQFCRLTDFYLYDVLVWDRITRIGLIFIPFLFLDFTYAFLGKALSKKAYLSYGTATAVFLLSDATSLFIKNVEPKGLYKYYPNPGFIYYFFVAFFVFTVLYCFSKILKEYRREKGLRRTQIGSYFIFCAVGFIGGSTNFLPVFDFPTGIYVIGTAIFAAFPILSIYSILRYDLLKLKTITAEILSLMILAALAANIFTSQSPDFLAYNILVFLVVLTLVIMLLRSVWREVKTKDILAEMVKQKTEDLQERNQELEKFYKLTIGRELRMAELKEKIRELEDNKIK